MHIQMLDCLLPVYLTMDDGNLLREQYKVAEHTTATYTAEEATAYWAHTCSALGEGNACQDNAGVIVLVCMESWYL